MLDNATIAMTDSAATAAASPKMTALHLIVNNHPGVMSHVCGLFARRAFNLEGILVAPSPPGQACDMWLLVNANGESGENGRLPQILSQVRKLHDVRSADAVDCDPAVFARLAEAMPR